MTATKGKLRVKCTINQSIGTLTWHFPTKGDVVLHIERVSPENREYSVPHGLKQRGADTMALETTKGADGKPVRPTEAEKYTELTEWIDWIETGTKEWSRKGAARVSTDRKLLARVVAELGAKLKVAIEDLKPAQVDALLARPKFKVVADRMRAEASASVDTDELVEELDDDETDVDDAA
jgi:hypothetical protein